MSLNESITGLKSLAVTYDTDASITATIEVMVDRIKSYSSHKHTKPQKKLISLDNGIFIFSF